MTKTSRDYCIKSKTTWVYVDHFTDVDNYHASLEDIDIKVKQIEQQYEQSSTHVLDSGACESLHHGEV